MGSKQQQHLTASQSPPVRTSSPSKAEPSIQQQPCSEEEEAKQLLLSQMADMGICLAQAKKNMLPKDFLRRGDLPSSCSIPSEGKSRAATAVHKPSEGRSKAASVLKPLRAPLDRVRHISARASHSLVVTATRSYSWGREEEEEDQDLPSAPSSSSATASMEPQAYRAEEVEEEEGPLQKLLLVIEAARTVPYSNTASVLKELLSTVETIFSSPSAINAAFGLREGQGFDILSFDSVSSALLRLYASPPRDSEQNASERKVNELKSFAVAQTLLKSTSNLLDDLLRHQKLPASAEAAQALLSIFQNPLLRFKEPFATTTHGQSFGRDLIPKLTLLLSSAPSATRKLLVKWWAQYPEALLQQVVQPLQVRHCYKGGTHGEVLGQGSQVPEPRVPDTWTPGIDDDERMFSSYEP